MNRAINIYVEGQGDLVFMCHFIKHKFEIEFTIDDSYLNGVSKNNSPLRLTIAVFDEDSENGGLDSKKITKLLKEINTSVTPLGIESILLIDSDTTDHCNPPGGYQNRNKHFGELSESNSFEYFLIPNNNDDGNLEDLLDKIISDRGKSFYDCLKNYVTCLSCLPCDKKPEEIRKTTDFNKKRMEWYTYMMQGKGNNKNSGSKRDYSKDIWDLDSPSLLSLYEFLKKKLT